MAKYPHGIIEEGSGGFFVYKCAADQETGDFAFVKTREEAEALLRGDSPDQNFFDGYDSQTEAQVAELKRRNAAKAGK